MTGYFFEILKITKMVSCRKKSSIFDQKNNFNYLLLTNGETYQKIIRPYDRKYYKLCSVQI